MAEQSTTGSSSVMDAVRRHPRGDDLARLVRTIAMTAADEQRRSLSDGLEELMREAQLSLADGLIESHNVLEALATGAIDGDARSLLGGLLARGIALAKPVGEEQADAAAAALSWIAAHTPLDGLSFLDEALGPGAEPLWQALARLIWEEDEAGAVRGRATAMVAAAALAASRSSGALAARTVLEDELQDRLLRLTLLSRSGGLQPFAGRDLFADEDELSAGAREKLEGELVPAPLGPVGLVLWALSGLLILRYLWRLVAAVLLRVKRPVALRVAASGITLSSQLKVMGRTVRSTELYIPVGNLARAVREVRYPRLTMYAGLIALALGSYLGVSFMVDGARAGSPSLLGLGAAIFGAGLVIDLVFSSLWHNVRGKYRLIFVPRKGRTIALSTPATAAADRVLRRLAGGADADT